MIINLKRLNHIIDLVGVDSGDCSVELSPVMRGWCRRNKVYIDDITLVDTDYTCDSIEFEFSDERTAQRFLEGIDEVNQFMRDNFPTPWRPRNGLRKPKVCIEK